MTFECVCAQLGKFASDSTIRDVFFLQIQLMNTSKYQTCFWEECTSVPDNAKIWGYNDFFCGLTWQRFPSALTIFITATMGIQMMQKMIMHQPTAVPQSGYDTEP